MKQLRDRIAVITGSGSGIGRALAQTLADEDCALALVDISESDLDETIRMLGPRARPVTRYVVDVADGRAVADLADRVVRDHGGVDLLINNAGVLMCDTLEDVSYENFEWVMGVNFWGPVHGVKAFLPHLKSRPEAHIVNMSSVAGLVTTPTNGPYAISKSAVKAFSETLAQELRHTNVRVSCVIAGGVKTGIFRNAPHMKSATPCMSCEETIVWYEQAAKTSAPQAARTIVKGIKKNKRRIMVGMDAHGIDAVTRLMPTFVNVCAGYMMSNLDKMNPRFWKRTRRSGKIAKD
jgi:NAD(P)-dependent dehydrogenase (short-subunit alcohol dehydrogenase family)